MLFFYLQDRNGLEWFMTTTASWIGWEESGSLYFRDGWKTSDGWAFWWSWTGKNVLDLGSGFMSYERKAKNGEPKWYFDFFFWVGFVYLGCHHGGSDTEFWYAVFNCWLLFLFSFSCTYEFETFNDTLFLWWPFMSPCVLLILEAVIVRPCLRAHLFHVDHYFVLCNLRQASSEVYVRVIH